MTGAFIGPQIGCPIADPNGIGALKYRTPSSLFEGLKVCWRWTNKITGGHNLPSPWAYREGFQTWPGSRETGSLNDPGQESVREVYNATPPPPPPPPGTLRLTLAAVHSGKCLDVNDSSLADGAVVQQWTCHGGTNQQWRLTTLR